VKLSEGFELFYGSMKGVLSDQTVLAYKNVLPSLVDYMGDIELDKVNLTELREWRGRLVDKRERWGKGSTHPRDLQPLSPYTVHKYVRSAKRFFLWCIEEELITRNPARRLEKPHLPKARAKGISPSDLAKMIQSAGQGPRPSKYTSTLDFSNRDKAIVMFLADTACRLAGVADLTFSDLDIDNQMAIVKEKGRGGWGKERSVFFTRATADQLYLWLDDRAAYKVESVRVFGLETDGIYRMLQRVAKRAGVETDWNPHSFRHAAIRAWLNNGMPIGEVAQLAGHSTVKVTSDVYGIVSDRTLQTDYNRYNWLCKA